MLEWLPTDTFLSSPDMDTQDLPSHLITDCQPHPRKAFDCDGGGHGDDGDAYLTARSSYWIPQTVPSDPTDRCLRLPATGSQS